MSIVINDWNRLYCLCQKVYMLNVCEVLPMLVEGKSTQAISDVELFKIYDD